MSFGLFEPDSWKSLQIESIVALSDTSVPVRLDRPGPFLGQELATPVLAPVFPPFLHPPELNVAEFLVLEWTKKNPRGWY